MGMNTQSFQGHVFGGHDNYLDDDFGQLHDPDSGFINDDEEQGELYGIENGWEPEWFGAQAESWQTNDSEDPTSHQANLDDHDEQLANTSRSQAEACNVDSSHIVVSYSDKYPDHQAGVPLKKKQSDDDNYHAALENLSNPWVPFSSQMDWEIAKWAKLQGAGSTVLSDLLAIGGVSYNCHIILHSTDIK